jgi:ArsR family transcriptional regulator
LISFPDIDERRYVDRSIDRRQYEHMKLIQTIDSECCPQLLAEPLDEGAADRLAAALRVLADPARLRLLSIIGAHPNGEACVCELTGPLGLSQPTVSHHLKVLADAGLVGREQRGRWVYFWVLPEPLELLRGALAAPVGSGMAVT